MLTLIDLSTIDFVADVSLRDLPSIHTGQICTVDFQSLPGYRFPARVDAIYPQTNEQSQTIDVRLKFAARSTGQSRLLRTDMAGTAAIIVGRHKDILMVPGPALLRNDETGEQTVVTVTADSLAHLVAVRVGATTDSLAEVAADGLHEGMQVVIEGNYSLPESTKVAVVLQDR